MRRICLAFCAALLLTACGANSPSSSAGPPSASGPDGYPVSIENCGRKPTVQSEPKRVVSLNQGSTEILESLGLADRIVGTATWTDPILPALAAANSRVPRLADKAPSYEAVLGADPDFVTASFTSTLGPGGLATRDQFAGLGVGTYVSPADCEGKAATGGDGSRTTPLTLDVIYQEITELSEIFDVRARGTGLVSDLQARVRAATASVQPTKPSSLHPRRTATVAFWFANSQSPYLAGCCGAPGIIANSLGLKNVFDDTEAEWPQIDWEVVASRDPEVLVIGDLTRKSQTAETAAAKIAYLESNPVTREMAAVKNHRYIIVTGGEMNPSIRTVYGIEDVAAGLRKLGLAG